MIIDEVQRVSLLLPAIKKVVGEDTRPGQFLLTGSANTQSLPGVTESLAGRIKKIRLHPLSEGEINPDLPLAVIKEILMGIEQLNQGQGTPYKFED